MKMDFKPVKVLNANVNNAENCAQFDESMIDQEGLALFNSKGTYEEIFGFKKGDASLEKQLLSPICISCGNRKIYRQYAGRGISINAKSIGLSPLSWQQLMLDKAKDKMVVVEACSKFKFFWNHSYSATRVSFRLGLFGVILAVVGILMTIVFRFI